jgi:Dyp-type peroxidase family
VRPRAQDGSAAVVQKLAEALDNGHVAGVERLTGPGAATAIRRALEGSGHWLRSPGDVRVAAPEAGVDGACEPLLDVDRIQAHVLAGFDAPLQTALFVQIVSLSDAKRWLGRVARRLTPLAARLADGDSSSVPPGGVAAAVTFAGLERLTADAATFSDVAFKQGLHRRATLLGDPRDRARRGHPSTWVVGGAGAIPDVLVLVAGADRAQLVGELARVVPGPRDGVRTLAVQQCAAVAGPHGAREHFGFRDPVSQPGVRGRVRDGADGFLTPRRNPLDPSHGYPGQRLVWPGEFVFGYPLQDATDLERPGLSAHAGPLWARNGSLLVVRRLEQDVAAFRRFVAATAVAVGDTPEQLAAKCVGRWPSGASLVHAPDRDDAALGEDPARNNDFGFAGDPLGAVCPQAAHIRKAYLRDHPTSAGGRAGIETHRLLRRSVAFGPPFPAPGRRGLLFMAYQTSIERQFEFVVRAWLNNPCLRDGDDGYDPIAGQNGRDADRRRRFALRAADGDERERTVVVALDEEWVTPTGGGYFFAPSCDTFAMLAG